MRSASEATTAHLSLCTLFSQLGRHAEAEKMASEAIRLAEMEILNLPPLRESSDGSGNGAAEVLREKASILAVAYNNLAVQKEHLGQVSECLALYEKAVVLGQSHMAADSLLLKRLKDSYAKATQANMRRSGEMKEQLPNLVKRRRPASAGTTPPRRADALRRQAAEHVMSARELHRELTTLLRGELDESEKRSMMATREVEQPQVPPKKPPPVAAPASKMLTTGGGDEPPCKDGASPPLQHHACSPEAPRPEEQGPRLFAARGHYKPAVPVKEGAGGGREGGGGAKEGGGAVALATLSSGTERRLRKIFDQCSVGSHGHQHLNKQTLIKICRRSPEVARFFRLPPQLCYADPQVPPTEVDAAGDLLERIFNGLGRHTHGAEAGQQLQEESEITWEMFRNFFLRRVASLGSQRAKRLASGRDRDSGPQRALIQALQEDAAMRLQEAFTGKDCSQEEDICLESLPVAATSPRFLLNSRGGKQRQREESEAARMKVEEEASELLREDSRQRSRERSAMLQADVESAQHAKDLREEEERRQQAAASAAASVAAAAAAAAELEEVKLLKQMQKQREEEEAARMQHEDACSELLREELQHRAREQAGMTLADSESARFMEEVREADRREAAEREERERQQRQLELEEREREREREQQREAEELAWMQLEDTASDLLRQEIRSCDRERSAMVLADEESRCYAEALLADAKKVESSILAPESTWQPLSSSAFEPEEEIAPPEPAEKVEADTDAASSPLKAEAGPVSQSPLKADPRATEAEGGAPPCSTSSSSSSDNKAAAVTVSCCWVCPHCNFCNEVSPDWCVLCDMARLEA